jgi:hypothetical protein
MSIAAACDADIVALLEHGAACVKVGRRSKRPLGVAWHESATTGHDAIARWIDDGYNVGILLGHGGLVDVEYDDAEGRRLVKQLGLLDAATPTYTSGRGEHRLFRLADAIPECGWRKIGGYEVRFGGLPAQSVLPPSRHPDGRWYSWTKSPRDFSPAVITLAQLGLEDC